MTLERLRLIQAGTIVPAPHMVYEERKETSELVYSLTSGLRGNVCARAQNESCSNDDSETSGSFCGGSCCGWCHSPQIMFVEGVRICYAPVCNG